MRWDWGRERLYELAAGLRRPRRARVKRPIRVRLADWLTKLANNRFAS